MRIKVALFLTAVGALAIVMWKEAPTMDAPVTQSSDWHRAMQDLFAGDSACMECHTQQWEAHQRSGHSHTMIAVQDFIWNGNVTFRRFSDPQRSYTFHISPKATGLAVEIPDHLPGVQLSVDWILGSGNHARTAVSISAERRLGIEHRWTFFDNSQTLGLTPAHDRFQYDVNKPSLDAYGRMLDWDSAMQCLGCHSTAVPANPKQFHAAGVIPNVTCERCHGPRKEHIELAARGLASSKPVFSFENADAYMDQCAQCHRDEQHLTSELQEKDLVRFQPLGLKRSKCYTRSKGELTCSTCHDPHDRVSRDRIAYRQICLGCHATPPQECNSSSNDCVSCHMSATSWEAGLVFHDHHIQRPPTPAESGP